METPRPTNTTALILSGGEGRRMGGADKGWVEYNGVPLILHALDMARSQCSEVIISANRHRERYAQLGARVVSDLTTGYQGPIAGILAGALDSSTPWLWVLPVDCPLTNPNLPTELAASVARTGASAAVAHDGVRDQPLFILLNQSAQARLLNYYLAGGRSIRGWLQAQLYVRTDCRRFKASFTNVNELTSVASGRQTSAGSSYDTGIGAPA